MGSPADLIIGQNLTRLRIDRGFARADLARRLAVSDDVLASYEDGMLRVPAALFYELAQTLRVPISAFFESCDIIAPALAAPAHPRLH